MAGPVIPHARLSPTLFFDKIENNSSHDENIKLQIIFFDEH